MTDNRDRHARITRQCFGYKLVVVLSITLQVPLIWTLIPATGDERVALRSMIRALYRMIPRLPTRHLVGDGLYGNDQSLLQWLDRRFGVIGVFPLHASVRKDLPYRATSGVPKCRHGWARHVGVRDEWAPQRRWELELAPGTPAPGAPGHRWECRAGHDCHEIRGTSARTDWRLFSPLPHTGDSRLAARRLALFHYRNVIESAFAAIKHRGVGADWPPRMRLGDDDTARWVISLALLRSTAARLAHASGAYDEALARATHLGLIEMHGQHPMPTNGVQPRAAEQQDILIDDIIAPLDSSPPDTSRLGLTLPIDEPYRLPDLNEYSDIPDRPIGPT